MNLDDLPQRYQNQARPQLAASHNLAAGVGAVELSGNLGQLPAKEGVSREIEELHGPILKWCANQMPAVPMYHARPDGPSGIHAGAADFCLFYKGRAIVIEAKTRVGKLSEDQRNWIHLMELQGFPVHIVRTMGQFYSLVNPGQPAIQ